jgi:lytic murein transglycosylase
VPRSLVIASLALVLATACGGPPSLRSAAAQTAPVPQATPEQAAAFQSWVAAFRPRAQAAGISAATLDAAFRGAVYRPDVIERDRNQAEFSRTLRQYLSNAVNDTRVNGGLAGLRQYGAVLAEIEARYNVDKEVIVAVWGMESTYGTRRGDIPTISALATLAEDGRRGAFFEQQLIAALRILQNGDVTPERMVGSWAGAMGHTQFIPTSYQALAVDFRGDGRRDIWSDDPTDALASTARYLADAGWTRGQPWGVEVRLPSGFNTALANRSTTRTPAEWAAAGVTAANGQPIGSNSPASILLPEGAGGPAFMIFRNFRAIERYNAADTYVIAVGHLSDRLRGGGDFLTVYGAGERPLTEAERIALQRGLTAAGYDTGGIDGRLGPASIAAIRAYQAANGLPVDGDATLGLLARVR